jgi:hypothetical protein
MTITHTKAPDIPNPAWPKGGYPTKGKRLGPAWDKMWRALERVGTEYLDGKELSDTVAKETDLSPATLVALLSRAAGAGILEKDTRAVSVPVVVRSKAHPEGRSIQSSRNRTFYRIKR